MKPCKRIHACRASSYLSGPGRNRACELVRHLPAMSGPAKRGKSAHSKEIILHTYHCEPADCRHPHERPIFGIENIIHRQLYCGLRIGHLVPSREVEDGRGVNAIFLENAPGSASDALGSHEAGRLTRKRTRDPYPSRRAEPRRQIPVCEPG